MNYLQPIIRRGFIWFCAIFLAGRLAAAESASNPAGHWEGAIALPTTPLAVRVDLERGTNQSWQGTIDIPVQSLRGFKLNPVKVDGDRVTFVMPGIPGDPEFAGRLGPDGKTIAGDFTQGGQKLSFKLERMARSAAAGPETPSRGVPGKGLVGHWQGSLKVSPIIELRLALDLRKSVSGELGGAMTSVDQDSATIPITALTEQAGAVHLETKSVGGVFDGKLSSDGSEIAGNWQQNGNTMPLVFKRLATTAKTEHP